jgi:choline dehydrogenase-like flavoprotein
MRKAKRATNVSDVPPAVATGNCEIVPDAFAMAILHDGGDDGRARARGVRWRDTRTGQLREAEARVIVLAGGSIESPRLWLNSALPDSNEAVGRYLTTHLQDIVTGFFDREVNPDVGQITMARADFPGHGTIFVQGNGVENVSIVLAGGGDGFWDEPPADEPWDLQGRFWGEEVVRRMRDYTGRSRSSSAPTTRRIPRIASRSPTPARRRARAGPQGPLPSDDALQGASGLAGAQGH